MDNSLFGDVEEIKAEAMLTIETSRFNAVIILCSDQDDTSGLWMGLRDMIDRSWLTETSSRHVKMTNDAQCHLVVAGQPAPNVTNDVYKKAGLIVAVTRPGAQTASMFEQFITQKLSFIPPSCRRRFYDVSKDERTVYDFKDRFHHLA